MTQIPKGSYVRIGRRKYPLRPKRKSRRKQIEAALDVAFSLYIRRRDKKCFTSNGKCRGVLQCGHLFSRRSRATRWDDRFSFAQCETHNFIHESRPEIMTAEFIGKFGNELYLEGVKLSQSVKKHSLAELEGLMEKYGA